MLGVSRSHQSPRNLSIAQLSPAPRRTYQCQSRLTSTTVVSSAQSQPTGNTPAYSEFTRLYTRASDTSLPDASTSRILARSPRDTTTSNDVPLPRIAGPVVQASQSHRAPSRRANNPLTPTPKARTRRPHPHPGPPPFVRAYYSIRVHHLLDVRLGNVSMRRRFRPSRLVLRSASRHLPVICTVL
ncbi:hypothetical protein L227DRAFT_580988 [Lentinus tigrinus ALCF2SS1-6]|uniref:Uncharacterized protein n=1 Tax=Lentinus tigrinus ALCF2SS1-6 TaxID=1328759 RepID=A0A5C2RUG9_9APHY|nr:hypothetical protein L227DRAFT_580988 [Lentinus tigrinus ALCF2SS1-6]